MPNDAKLGLVLGVGLVIAVAVVFFHKAPVAAQPGGGNGTAINPAAVDNNAPPAPVKPARPARSVSMSRAPRQHTVQEGDTLFSVARRYYGDGARFVEVYRANRQTLTAPDALQPGTVLTIPDVAEGSE